LFEAMPSLQIRDVPAPLQWQQSPEELIRADRER
jgi:hypothetical protein